VQSTYVFLRQPAIAEQSRLMSTRLAGPSTAHVLAHVGFAVSALFGRALINAQIAAGRALRVRHRQYLVTLYFCLRLFKKFHSLRSSTRRIIPTRGNSCADPRPSRLGRG
jgi:hypothetical protein